MKYLLDHGNSHTLQRPAKSKLRKRRSGLRPLTIDQLSEKEAAVDRDELLQQLIEVRSLVRERIGIAALTIMPTTACDRLIAGLLDNLYDLEALLRPKS